jgi:hypothetical protein
MGIMYKIDVGPPLFTLLQSEMLTYGARSGWCNQPLTLCYFLVVNELGTFTNIAMGRHIKHVIWLYTGSDIIIMLTIT